MDLPQLAGGTLVRPQRAPAPVAFAADELATYLARLCGARPQIVEQPGPPGAWLRLVRGTRSQADVPLPSPSADAEWIVEPTADALALVATSPRALLAAGYALLEAAGCRWSPRGRGAEHVPGPREVRSAPPRLVGRPTFARRAWASDLGTWHYSVAERLASRLEADVAFVDWIAKTGGTALLFIRHANDTEWVVPALVPELGRRGLAVEGGGHVVPELLPRALFADHPEYFPAAADGGRFDDGNLCTASPAALAVVRREADRARAALPAGADFHVWGLDLLGGGWCRCAACRDLSPSDQALRLCNAVVDGPGEGRVFHLAYHDTIGAPRTVRPDPRVWAEFAPRERCYGHTLDDSRCPANRSYHEALIAHLELFAGRVDVFEYYGDAILFGGCAVPLTEVIAGDLAFYRRVGVRGVSCLVFGAYSLLAYGANVEAFACGAIDLEAAASAMQRHCTDAYGAAAVPMARYLAALERLMAGLVSYGDVKLPPRRPDAAAAVLEAIDRALAEAPAVRRLLESATGGPPARLSAERHLLAYTLDTLQAVRRWLAARRDARGDEIAQALADMAAALAHVGAIDPQLAGTWGRYDLELAHAFVESALTAV